MNFIETLGLGHYKIHSLLDPNDEHMGMRYFNHGPICLNLRALQGLKGLLLNWDLDIGGLSISLCWWRPHKLGIGQRNPDKKNCGAVGGIEDWLWYLQIPGGWYRVA